MNIPIPFSVKRKSQNVTLTVRQKTNAKKADCLSTDLL